MPAIWNRGWTTWRSRPISSKRHWLTWRGLRLCSAPVLTIFRSDLTKGWSTHRPRWKRQRNLQWRRCSRRNALPHERYRNLNHKRRNVLTVTANPKPPRPHILVTLAVFKYLFPMRTLLLTLTLFFGVSLSSSAQAWLNLMNLPQFSEPSESSSITNNGIRGNIILTSAMANAFSLAKTWLTQ